MFCAPNGLDKLMEGRFEFPFILFDKLMMAFLTSQSCYVLKSWYTGGDPEQGLFLALFCRQFIQTLVLSMTQGKKTCFSAPVKSDYKKMYCSSFCHHASEFSGSLWFRLQ